MRDQVHGAPILSNTGVPGAQILDDYERDLVLTPTWVSAAKARKVNEELLQTRRDEPDLPWLLRETQVLQWLENSHR